MYRLILKQSLSVITYDPLKVCGGVCICVILFFRASASLGKDRWSVEFRPKAVDTDSLSWWRAKPKRLC